MKNGRHSGAVAFVSSSPRAHCTIRHRSPPLPFACAAMTNPVYHAGSSSSRGARSSTRRGCRFSISTGPTGRPQRWRVSSVDASSGSWPIRRSWPESARFARPANNRDWNFNRGGSTIRRVYDAITGRGSTDWRVAAWPPTRSCALRAVGPVVTVEKRCRRGPIRRAGGTAAHAEGPRVVAGRPGRTQVAGGAWADERGARAVCPGSRALRRGGAPWPGVRPTGGAGPEVGKDLVDHRHRRDERDEAQRGLGDGHHGHSDVARVALPRGGH